MSRGNPSKIAQKLLQAMLPSEDRETVVGDFHESFYEIIQIEGIDSAKRWYWQEVLSSLPFFFSRLLTTIFTRRFSMIDSTLISPGRKSALWGFVFLVPALFVAVPGILFTLFGRANVFSGLQSYDTVWSALTHPAVVLGGLAIALLINLLSILSVSIENSADELKGKVLIKKSGWNIAPLVLGSVLGMIIFLYLVAENFGPFF